MKWYPITNETTVQDLKYSVLLLDSEGFVQVFLSQEQFFIHLRFAKMGLERDFPITHWAHFNLPPKPRKQKKQNNDASGTCR